MTVVLAHESVSLVQIDRNYLQGTQLYHRYALTLAM